MEHVYLIAAVVCLIASWIYILLLKARIRDCASYIQNRLLRSNQGVGREDENFREPIASQATADIDGQRPGGSLLSTAETLMRPCTPQLVADESADVQPIHYVCSDCRLPLPLPLNKPLAEALGELLGHFEEHIKHAHPRERTEATH